MRICLVSTGLEERNRLLQPWRYLFEAAQVLSESGHEVHLLSDGYPRLPSGATLGGLPVTRLASVADWPLRGNPALLGALEALAPDAVLWHLGLTGFLRLSTPRRPRVPVIGLFTSPVYHPQELLRLGFIRLLRGWRLSAIHLLGLLVPGLLLRRALRRGVLHDLVVECETTKARLVERGVPADRLYVIRPGIDMAWFEAALSPVERAEVRRELGYSMEDVIVGYFGPPAPLRGLPGLIRATAMARENEPAIRLLALSRQRDGELDPEQRTVEALAGQFDAGRWVRIEPGFLPQERLIRALAACDLVALPFELVPSDVPLSVLEAMALGLPVVTTDVACLPELVPDGAGFRVPPRETQRLAIVIGTLAIDREQRERLGRAAWQHAHAWQASCLRDRGWDRLVAGWKGPA